MLVVALAAKAVDTHNDAKNEHQAKPIGRKNLTESLKF